MQNRAEKKPDEPIDSLLVPLENIDELKITQQGRLRVTSLSAEKLAIYSNWTPLSVTYFYISEKKQEEEQVTNTRHLSYHLFYYPYDIRGFGCINAAPFTSPSILFTDVPSLLYAKNSGNPLTHLALRHMSYATIMPDQEHLVLWGTRYNFLTIVIFNLTNSTVYRHTIYSLHGENARHCRIFAASKEQFFIERPRRKPHIHFKFTLYSLRFNCANGLPNYQAKPKLGDAINVRSQHTSMAVSPDGNWLATIHKERVGELRLRRLCILPYDTQKHCLKEDYNHSTMGYDQLGRQIVQEKKVSGHWLADSRGYIFNYKERDGHYYTFYVDIRNFATRRLCDAPSYFSITQDGRLWLLNTREQKLGFSYSTKFDPDALKKALSQHYNTIPIVLIDIIIAYVNDFSLFSAPEFTPSQHLPPPLQDEMKKLMEKYVSNKTEYQNNIATLTYFNNLAQTKPHSSLSTRVEQTKTVYWDFFRRKHRRPCYSFFKAVIEHEKTAEKSEQNTRAAHSPN